jgi:hypothetical protein
MPSKEAQKLAAAQKREAEKKRRAADRLQLARMAGPVGETPAQQKKRVADWKRKQAMKKHETAERARVSTPKKPKPKPKPTSQQVRSKQAEKTRESIAGGVSGRQQLIEAMKPKKKKKK